MRLHHAVIALSLIATFTACASGQDKKPEQKADDKKSAKGEIVTELGKSVMYVFQAKNNGYWFGSND